MAKCRLLKTAVPAVIADTLLIGGIPSTANAAVSSQTQKINPVNGSVSLKNSILGQYLWQGKDKSPNYTNSDSYQRLLWRGVEPTKRNYDTWEIDKGLKDAAAKKGKFSFRIMSVCQGCSADGKTLVWKLIPRE